MKNIYVPLEYSKLTGGMLHSTIILCKELSKIYNVIVILPKDSNYTDFLDNLNISYIKVGKEIDWRVNFNIMLIYKIYKLRKILIKEIRATCSGNDIILCNNITSALFFTLPYKLIKNTKTIYVIRGGIYSGKILYAYKSISRNVDWFVFISKDQCKKFLTKVNNNISYTLIHNPINKPNTELNIPYSYDRIAVIGYFSEGKNQLLILNALAILKRKNIIFHCHFFGEAGSEADEVYLKSMLEFIKNNQIEEQIIFHGYVTNKDEIYKNCDIVLSTSLHEGFGRTLAEGMLYKKLVIGMSQAGGPLEIIQNNKTGLLINENNPNEVVKMLMHIKNNPEIMQSIIKYGYDFASANFSPEKIANDYKKLLERLF